MKLSWLLLLNAAILGLFAALALLFPGPLYDSFGGRSDVGSQFVVRLAGSVMLGEALLRFGLRDVQPGHVRGWLTGAALVEYGIAAAAAYIAQSTGVTNQSGWIIIALPALLAAGYAYFRFAPA